MGDVPLASGRRLADYAHDGRFVLIDRTADGRFADAVRLLDDRIVQVADPTADPDRPSLLVRPDGIVIRAAHEADEPAAAAKRFATAGLRWAGTGRPTSPSPLRARTRAPDGLVGGDGSLRPGRSCRRARCPARARAGRWGGRGGAGTGGWRRR
ncbi:hypothetical protein [Embleya sp. NPDC059237]|uniref:aromatic-ring hydroxylase C-terminal domain-containing protein n=1 Tax=Embleya sp. NPDC059237 TaxID=3346784 RepID=UPI00368EB638